MGWIKPQIDDVVSIGANCIRLIGNTACVASGDITQAQYLLQWTQLLDYADSLGVRVYPCCDDYGHWGSTTLEQVEDMVGHLGALFNERSNVVGIDVMNESFARWGSDQVIEDLGGLVDMLTTLTAALRAVTDIPLTHSRTVLTADRWHSFEGIYLDRISDFISAHVYYDVAPVDLATLKLNQWGTKPILVSEFGAPLSASSAERAARYESVRLLVATDTQVLGALAWAGYDTDTASSATQFGLFDETRTARTDITDAFETFPTSR